MKYISWTLAIGFYVGVAINAFEKSIWIGAAWIVIFPIAFYIEYNRQKKENELENRKIKKG